MAAGDIHTILKPKIYVAPYTAGQLFPNLTNHATTGIAYPSGWELVKRTGNGAQITFNAPMQDITSDEVGVIGVVGAGTENVTIAFQTRTPSMKLISYLAHLKKAAITGAGPLIPHDQYKLDVMSQPIMVAVEGQYAAGGLEATAGKVLAIAHYCFQTENAQIVARTTGADAIVSPAATVRALAQPIQAAQIPAASGYSQTANVYDEKFNMLLLPPGA